MEKKVRVKAKVSFIVTCDERHIGDLLDIKRAVESGEFQREYSQDGWKIKATFRYLERDGI